MRFQPLHFSWVALPPRPKAVVVFIGGAFFGTYPTFFYRGFLRVLYDHGYAVVALPFRFTFRHWDIALSVSIGLAELKKEVSALLESAASDQGLPEQNTKTSLPYLWVAHSLGCKYVALLELLSESEDMGSLRAIKEAFAEVDPRQLKELLAKLAMVDAEQLSLRNQPQLLVDPVIASLDAAIPWKPLETIFAPLLKVIPSRETTFRLIDQSTLFSLTKIFSLQSKTAHDTIERLKQVVRKPPLQPIETVQVKLARSKPPLGAHLAILGFNSTDAAIAETITTALAVAEEEAWIRQCGTPG
ncbi:MAG: DUF1350 family protein [Cyanobacteriota bacterium]|nr:DUF1350 family protein [Cyanobacteriota bacterium]